MTQEFDSAALAALNRAYGLSGVDAEQQTFLDDGNIAQVLPVDGIARRGRTPINPLLDGLFHSVHQNTHGVASELQSFIDPFSPVNPQSGWPTVNPLDLDWDIWLRGFSTFCAAGAGNLVTFGLAGLDARIEQQMMSDLASGGPVGAANREMALQAWTEYTGIATVTGDVGQTAAGEVFAPMKMRWPRGGSALSFRSEVTAATTVILMTLWQVVPSALGQDAW